MTTVTLRGAGKGLGARARVSANAFQLDARPVVAAMMASVDLIQNTLLLVWMASMLQDVPDSCGPDCLQSALQQPCCQNM